MNTEEKALTIVLNRKPRKGADYPEITNQELLGCGKPSNSFEKHGMDSLAAEMRQAIRDSLETEHGLSLVPLDYRGTWIIVPIDAAAAHNVHKRLKKIESAMTNAASMVEDYRTNPHITEEMDRTLRSCDRVTKWVVEYLEDALQPKLNRLYGVLEDHEPLLLDVDEK